MNSNQDNSQTIFDAWLEKSINPIPVSQLNKFHDITSIDAHRIGEFSPSALARKLSLKTGSKVLGIDLGGGSARGGVYQIEADGSLALTGDFSEATEAENGAGFLAQLERLSLYAEQQNIPVGMSYGGPLDGSKPLFHPKIALLMTELAEKYDGDFANIFKTSATILNDGSAGLVRSVEMVHGTGIENPVVFYLINGGGLGLAVYKDGVLFSTEAGHTECVPDLNKNTATRSCGIYGDHVCLENVISNKQGLERQWLVATGNSLSGREIENMFKEGNPLAELLYEQVAVGQAALIQGVANIFNVDIYDPNFAVVVHGGMQRTPNLRERTAQILWQEKNPSKLIHFTEEFDQNACMHGAALMAEAK